MLCGRGAIERVYDDWHKAEDKFKVTGLSEKLRQFRFLLSPEQYKISDAFVEALVTKQRSDCLAQRMLKDEVLDVILDDEDAVGKSKAIVPSSSF